MKQWHIAVHHIATFLSVFYSLLLLKEKNTKGFRFGLLLSFFITQLLALCKIFCGKSISTKNFGTFLKTEKDRNYYCTILALSSALFKIGIPFLLRNRNV